MSGMKVINFIVFTILFSVFSSGQNNINNSDSVLVQDSLSYMVYGDKINLKNTYTAVEINKKYKVLKEGDSLATKFRATVRSVCKAKGCWMKLELDKGEEVMVRFKDYAFFVPKNIEGKEVIVAGKAFVKTTSIEEQKHYALDAGKSKIEIAKITKPKKELAFVAEGVLLKK